MFFFSFWKIYQDLFILFLLVNCLFFVQPWKIAFPHLLQNPSTGDLQKKISPSLINNTEIIPTGFFIVPRVGCCCPLIFFTLIFPPPWGILFFFSIIPNAIEDFGEAEDIFVTEVRAGLMHLKFPVWDRRGKHASFHPPFFQNQWKYFLG